MTLEYKIIPVTAFQQNCSVLKCTDTGELAIVDPGGDAEAILAVCQSMGGNIKQILVTHAHIDHAGAVAELSETLNLPIIGPHKGDQFWIDGLPKQSAMFGLPPARVFKPTRWLEHGDDVMVGKQKLQVVHCPGHTPGHVVFYHDKSQLAVVGDVLFAGSIGRTDFPGGNHQELLDSISQRLWPLGSDISFIPGHGPTSTFADERKRNPFVSDTALAS